MEPGARSRDRHPGWRMWGSHGACAPAGPVTCSLHAGGPSARPEPHSGKQGCCSRGVTFQSGGHGQQTHGCQLVNSVRATRQLEGVGPGAMAQLLTQGRPGWGRSGGLSGGTCKQAGEGAAGGAGGAHRPASGRDKPGAGARAVQPPTSAFSTRLSGSPALFSLSFSWKGSGEGKHANYGSASWTAFTSLEPCCYVVCT